MKDPSLKKKKRLESAHVKVKWAKKVKSNQSSWRVAQSGQIASYIHVSSVLTLTVARLYTSLMTAVQAFYKH